MSQKLFQVRIPNLAQIVFNYYQMNYKCYFSFIYYDVVTMATNVAQYNPYPHIRFTMVWDEITYPFLNFNKATVEV